MNLFVYTALNKDLKSQLREQLPATVQPVFKDELPENELLKTFHSAEIIMGNPPAAWFTQIPPQLAFWQLDSAGFENYRHLHVAAPVANMGDFYAQPCAETMVGGILAFYRSLPLLIRYQDQKKWVGNKIRPSLHLLGHKKVIILGAGSIGQAIKQMLLGFGCEVKMTARRNPEADMHSLDEIMAALPEIDVVVNTLPGGLDKYVSAAFIQAMKPSSLYASVGRGKTTDEQALIVALQQGKLVGAVLDVTEQEPLPETSPLWEMENVILTQHTGGGYWAEDEGKVKKFLSNLTRFLQQEEIESQVDLTQGY